MFKKSNIKTIKAIVVSNKMQKTIAVKIIRKVKHPLYKKVITRFTKVLVHDEKEECKIGDSVLIRAHRPISKRKSWILVNKINLEN